MNVEPETAAIRNAVIELVRGIESKSLSTSDVKEQYAILEKYVPVHGLNGQELLNMIAAITNPKTTIPVSILRQMVRSILIPRSLVSTEVILMICGCLGSPDSKKGTGVVPVEVQIELIRWLILISGFTKDVKIFERLYGFLFSYLSYQFLAPSLAQLLFLHTKRKHVKPFRTEFLMDLYRKNRDCQQVIGLLLLYREYFPENIADTFPKIKPNVFSIPNPEFFKTLAALHGKEATMKVSSKFEDFEERTKKRKIDSRKSSIYGLSFNVSASRELYSVESALNNLDIIEFPIQVGAVLRNPESLLRILALKEHTYPVWQQLESWLSFVLHNKDVSEKDIESLLDQIIVFTEYTNRLLFPVEEFLYKVLASWNGVRLRKQILVLLPYVSCQTWSNFYLNILRGIEQLMVSDNNPQIQPTVDHVELTALCFQAFAELVKRWAGFLENKSTLPPYVGESDVRLCIMKLSNEVAALGLRKLERYNDHPAIQMAVIEYFETVVSVPVKEYSIPSFLLPPALVYRYLLSGNPVAFSKICGYIARVKPFFAEYAMDLQFSREVQLYNSYVMDICNLTWRNRAFSVRDKGSKGLMLNRNFVLTLGKPIEQREHISNMYSLFHSAAFVKIAAELVRELEDADPAVTKRHVGPVTHQSYSALTASGGLQLSFDDLRVKLLKRLEENGFDGVGVLLFASIKSLINRKKGEAQSASNGATALKQKPFLQ